MTEPQAKSIPFEVQASFVDSLYRGGSSLIAGAILQAVAVAGSWLESGQDVFLYLIGAILVIGVWRLIETHAYNSQENPVTTPESARKWELRYLYSTVAAAVLLGVYAFLGIYLYPSEYSSLASAIIAAGSMASIVGRIYGSSRIVTAMVASVALPLSFALLLRGDLAHIALAILAMPFFLLVRSNAARVREHLFEATERRKQAQALAERFDLALNNMTHGLLMLDEQQCIEVANEKALSLLGLDNAAHLEGRNLTSLIRYSSAKGIVEKSDLPKLSALLKRMETSSIERKTHVRFANGIYIEFSLRPRVGGGGVLIFEDVTDRIRSEKKIQHMARFDMLTGLANRAEISNVAAVMFGKAPQGTTSAVFLLDLNDFKHINDTYGHPTGDAILRQVASRLTALETANMRASRLGGDEFLLVGTGSSRAGRRYLRQQAVRPAVRHLRAR
ncbi:MAG: diguanylate cyclase [Brucellaceae bacterium]|nr:diguanylate cyclase [Brucellaceae bacterium]